MKVGFLAVCFFVILAVPVKNLKANDGGAIFTEKKKLTFEQSKNVCTTEGRMFHSFETEESLKSLNLILRKQQLASSWLGIKKKHVHMQWNDKSTLDRQLNIRQKARKNECGLFSVKLNQIQISTCNRSGIGILCQRKPCLSCSEKHTKSMCFTHNNRCFIIFCGIRDWFEAQTLCHKEGGTLAILNDLDIRLAVRKSIIKRHQTCDLYWIGLTTFVWYHVDTGNNITNNLWKNHEPHFSFECAILEQTNDTSPKWTSKSCRDAHPVICEQVKSITLDAVPGSTTDSFEVTDSERHSRIWMIPVVVGPLMFAILITICVVIRYCKKNRQRETPRTTDSSELEQLNPKDNCNIDKKNTARKENKRLPENILDSDRKKILVDKAAELLDRISISGTEMLEKLKTLHLYSKTYQLLDESTCEQLKGCNDMKEKTRIILDLLKNKTNGDFDAFCQILCEHGQKDVVKDTLSNENDLQNCREKLSKHIEKHFSDIQFYKHSSKPLNTQLSSFYISMNWKKMTSLAQNSLHPPEDVELCSPLDLLHEISETQFKRLVIEGEPGMGKTTFVKAFCKTWSATVNHLNEDTLYDKEKVKSYSIVLPILMRVISNESDLFNIVKNQYKNFGPCEIMSILNIIENFPEKICILLDGLDEIPNLENQDEIMDIINGNNLSKVLCMTTTRSNAVSSVMEFSSMFLQNHIRLCGFNKPQVQIFVTKYFLEDDENAKHLLKEISEKNLWKLARIPIRLQIMCFVWKYHGTLGEKVCELYNKFTDCLLSHMEEREGRSQRGRKERSVQYEKSILIPASKLANRWDDHHQLKILFPEDDIDSNSREEIFRFGCITKYFPSILPDRSLWNFTHLSLQEYLIAYGIAKDKEQTVEHFQINCSDAFSLAKHQLILQFLCYLHPAKANKILCNIIKNTTGAHACEVLLHLLLKLLDEYENVTKAEIPLPQIVSIGQQKSTENYLNSFVLKKGKVKTNLSFLFKCDSKKFQNMKLLKIYDMGSSPISLDCSYLKGLTLHLNQFSPKDSVSELLKKLSNSVEMVDIDFSDSELGDMLYILANSNICTLFVSGKNITEHVCSLISSLPHLEELQLREQNVHDTTNIIAFCDCVKKSVIKKITIHRDILEECMVDLVGENRQLVIKSHKNTQQTLQKFTSELTRTSHNVQELDLSLTNFKCEISTKPGKLIGNLLIFLHSLEVFRMRCCGINDEILLDMKRTINQSSQAIRLKELDILGNLISDCDVLQNVLQSFKFLLVANVTCLGARFMEIPISKCMISGTQSRETCTHINDSMRHIEELYFIYSRPVISDSALVADYKLKVLYCLNTPYPDEALQELTKILPRLVQLEELYFTTTNRESLQLKNWQSLLEQLPSSLCILNITGYGIPSCSTISRVKNKLNHVKKFVIGNNFGLTDSDHIQTVRQELHQINKEIDIYKDNSESLIKLLFCRLKPPSESDLNLSSCMKEAEEILEAIHT